MTPTKTLGSSPALDLEPARRVLAEAIEQCEAAETALQAAEAALKAASVNAENAEIDLVSAETSVELALEGQTRRMVAIAGGGPHTSAPHSDVEQARAALRGASDGLAAAKGARSRIEQTKIEAAHALGKAQQRVKHEIGELLLAEAPRLVADAEISRKTAEASRLALMAVLDAADFNDNSQRERHQGIASYLARSPFDEAQRDPGRHPVGQAWRLAREALRKDASAALPT